MLSNLPTPLQFLFPFPTQDWLQYSDEASPDYAETSESLWMESPEIDVEGDQAETAPRVSRALSGGSRPVSAGMWRQLLNDFVSNSRRFRGRTKKGPGRGCFGGKLDLSFGGSLHRPDPWGELLISICPSLDMPHGCSRSYRDRGSCKS
uniref:Uncharacterized protein n=1 Tax=Eptatretus burgeri TaxID=7764 RepID=A0A8C4NHV1_EPTBU